MPYRIGAKGSFGCSGYPALKEGSNEVIGCHKTRSAAASQIFLINRNEGNLGKSMHELKEGDFVMGVTKKGVVHGRVEHVMREGGTLGTPGSKYSLTSMPPDNPAMSVKVYEEEEDGKWEETAYSIGMMHNDARKLDTLEGHTMDSEKDMAMYDSSIGKAYQDCGCATCKKLNVACKDCPKCSEEMDMGKSYHSDNEDMDKWDNIQKACWDGYEQQGMKDKGGRKVPNCVYVGKSKDVEKAASVSVGDHVTFGVPKPPDKTESAHGVVERVERSGTVKLPGTNESVEASSDKPVAIVRVYATNDKGKRTKTDRRVAKPVSALRVSSEPIDNDKMYDEDDMEKASESKLRELVQEYNKGKEGNKRITVGTLQAVYRRGIGAYRSNPSSVRGSVSSPQQWAMGRVNAFMAGLRGRFPRKAFDTDLFPKGHPRATSEKVFEGFAQEVAKPTRVIKLFPDLEEEETNQINKNNDEWGGSLFDLNPFRK